MLSIFKNFGQHPVSQQILDR